MGGKSGRKGGPKEERKGRGGNKRGRGGGGGAKREVTRKEKRKMGRDD